MCLFLRITDLPAEKYEEQDMLIFFVSATPGGCLPFEFHQASLLVGDGYKNKKEKNYALCEAARCSIEAGSKSANEVMPNS